jgi:transposase
MSYKIAGIDVHKKVLMVVVMDASTPESKPERRRFTTMPSDLRRLLSWLQEQRVEEAVMESTAQYWRSVWLELEPYMRLQLAQAFSNRAPRGRKHDFKDAERLVRRLIADELILSFVPAGEQRTWRNLTSDETAAHARPVTTAESDGVSARRDADQTVRCSQRFAGS